MTLTVLQVLLHTFPNSLLKILPDCLFLQICAAVVRSSAFMLSICLYQLVKRINSMLLQMLMGGGGSFSAGGPGKGMYSRLCMLQSLFSFISIYTCFFFFCSVLRCSFKILA